MVSWDGRSTVTFLPRPGELRAVTRRGYTTLLDATGFDRIVRVLGLMRQLHV